MKTSARFFCPCCKRFHASRAPAHGQADWAHCDASKARWQNSAARRRNHARYRARLLRILGWAPEAFGPLHPESYCASTGELKAYVREEMIARGTKGAARRGDQPYKPARLESGAGFHG